jgi:hypothetical protein
VCLPLLTLPPKSRTIHLNKSELTKISNSPFLHIVRQSTMFRSTMSRLSQSCRSRILAPLSRANIAVTQATSLVPPFSVDSRVSGFRGRVLTYRPESRSYGATQNQNPPSRDSDSKIFSEAIRYGNNEMQFANTTPSVSRAIAMHVQACEKSLRHHRSEITRLLQARRLSSVTDHTVPLTTYQQRRAASDLWELEQKIAQTTFQGSFLYSRNSLNPTKAASSYNPTGLSDTDRCYTVTSSASGWSNRSVSGVHTSAASGETGPNGGRSVYRTPSRYSIPLSRTKFDPRPTTTGPWTSRSSSRKPIGALPSQSSASRPYTTGQPQSQRAHYTKTLESDQAVKILSSQARTHARLDRPYGSYVTDSQSVVTPLRSAMRPGPSQFV